MSVSINGTSGLVFTDGSTQNTSPFGGMGFRNRIINGDMRIDQRNNGATVLPSNSYTVDRWNFNTGAFQKITVGRNYGNVTPPTGFTNYLGAAVTTAYNVGSTEYFDLNQPIEGFNASDFAWGTANAQPATLSFWVRSSLTGTFGGYIATSSGKSFLFSYQINASNTWEYKTVTIPGDTTSGSYNYGNGQFCWVSWSLSTGSSIVGTANTWSSTTLRGVTGQVNLVGTQGATFYITGVQLEKGSTATSFDYRPYGTELALCQRYCQAFRGVGATGVGTTGFYGDANQISFVPLGGLSAISLRDAGSASITMQGTQGTDWAVTTSGGTNQTGFTMAISAGNVYYATKTSHGLTPASTFLRNLTTSGAVIITSEI